MDRMLSSVPPSRRRDAPTVSASRSLWRFSAATPATAESAASLYWRASVGVHQSGDGLVLPAGESVGFDTYFAVFSVDAWRRHTGVRDVSLQVGTRGPVRVEVLHRRAADAPSTIVAQQQFDSPDLETHELTLPALDLLRGGLLTLRVVAHESDAFVGDAAWCTRDVPARDVACNVVITTFNRPDQLAANLERLAGAFAVNPAREQQIRVTVVDNGGRSTGALPEHGWLDVVTNPNLGGAGGFARGLIRARARSTATHVIFMDDDVRFDPEIVFRTLDFLTFAVDDQACVAGAMLDADRPTQIVEAGAQYRGKALNPNVALSAGVDVAEVDALFSADDEDVPVSYGAWWFLAFPLGLTRDNPVPTFLRGDDVLWGLLHTTGHVVTLPGIGVWHDSFELKNGPPTWFYETRNLGLAGMIAVPAYRWRHLVFRYLNLCGRCALSLKYASAEHVTFAMRELLMGPTHWLAVDQTALHARVLDHVDERIEPLSDEMREVPDLASPHGVSRVVGSCWSMLTLGGHLLPPAMDRRPLEAAPVQHRVFAACPGRRVILFRDSSRRMGFVARRDRRRFFRIARDMVSTAVRIPRQFRRVRDAYRVAYPEMCSDVYWQRQFSRASARSSLDAGQLDHAREAGNLSVELGEAP